MALSNWCSSKGAESVPKSASGMEFVSANLPLGSEVHRETNRSEGIEGTSQDHLTHDTPFCKFYPETPQRNDSSQAWYYLFLPLHVTSHDVRIHLILTRQQTNYSMRIAGFQVAVSVVLKSHFKIKVSNSFFAPANWLTCRSLGCLSLSWWWTLRPFRRWGEGLLCLGG